MTTTLTAPRRVGHPFAGRLPAVAGICGPVLFTITFLLEGVLRDDHDPIAQPISALEAGPSGWVQQVNFVVFGLCTLVFALGLHQSMARGRLSWVPTTLLGVSAFGLFFAAAFPLRLDAGGDVYDPGLHAVSGFTYFSASALALVALSRRMAADPAWRSLAAYTLVAGSLAATAFVLLGWFVIPDGAPWHAYAGLIQRATILLITFPCLVASASRLWRLAAT
jgi:hypothetical membrane protein